ncbi:hypothetical protein MMC13_002070 [Lambiella insularis]|nr:hypothetical protein [Lambiella insularis]
MDSAAVGMLQASHAILARQSTNPSTATRPPVYKAIGISLAVASGVFIGISFVLKKVGLLKANVKYNEEAGEGYGYLKNAYWWTGMTLMIIGEICNFVAYAFVDAILVTPLGALSVVITTILSAIFLKERLSFVGKVGCFICIVGSIIILLNAPEQSSAATIQEMQSFVIAPGFLSYAGVVIIGCAFIAFWVGPRYGKKSMLVYLSICSLIGGLSVVATQGLGAAVVAQAGGTQQFNQWFLYVLFVFVVGTLLTEIIFLNKALNIFNAALVTPTYYVFFTSSTIVSSAILFRGFKGTATSIATIIMGFLEICSGVILLQLSKSAKDVPDAAVFAGDLDQVRTVAEQEEPESEPKADAIRGTAAIIRRMSQSRQKLEAAEAKRVHEDRMKDHMEPIGENEQVEWDGLRRRKTIIGAPGDSLHRRKTLHPPLGLTHFPNDEEAGQRTGSRGWAEGTGIGGALLHSVRRSRARSALAPVHFNDAEPVTPILNQLASPTGHEEITIPPYKSVNTDIETRYSNQPDGAMEMSHVYGLPPGLQRPTFDGSHSPDPSVTNHGRPIAWSTDVENHIRSSESLAPNALAHPARRQFSFQNVFHRNRSDFTPDNPPVRKGLGSRTTSKEHSTPGLKTATEEERLGLVKGDSSNTLPLHHSDSDANSSTSDLPLHEKDYEEDDTQRRRWGGHDTGPDNRARQRRREKSDDSESETELPGYFPTSEDKGGGGPGAGAFI